MLKSMTNDYIKDLLIRMAHNSTAIEGNTLTQAETASILLNKYIPREMSEREYYEVKNHEKALDFLLESTDKRMSSYIVKSYHQILMKNLRWCDDYNYRMSNAKTDIEKVEIIVDQHIKFERIHPFSDGKRKWILESGL